MINYKYGKIYKIIGNGYTYIGSTCKPLKKRLNGHIYAYNRYKNNNRNAYTSSFNCFEGENKYDIVLLENFPCNNKHELLTREAYFIRKLECVNKNLPIREKEENINNMNIVIDEEEEITEDITENNLFDEDEIQNLIV